jgi:hypothetical protein
MRHATGRAREAGLAKKLDGFVDVIGLAGSKARL